MFYDVFVQLCKERGVSPTRATLDIGVNKSNVTTWRTKGFTPNGDTLQKFSDYFGVTVDYLLTGEQKEKPSAEAEGQISDELKEVLEYYQNKPGMRLLFSVTKDATPEDIIDAAEKIEAAKRKRTHE